MLRPSAQHSELKQLAMGMSINDPSSLEFIISACGEAGLMLLSLALYILWHRNKKTVKDSTNNRKSLRRYYGR